MSFHYDPTLEHRTTHAKWARGVAARHIGSQLFERLEGVNMRLGIRTIAWVIVVAASMCGADRQVQLEELLPPTGDVCITSSNYLLRPPDASRSIRVSPMAQECVERESQRSAIMGARRLTHYDNHP
jgi:hypothetical protein